MGPPLKAAENPDSVPRGVVSRRRFNGAAAKSSGKLSPVVVPVAHDRMLQWGRR